MSPGKRRRVEHLAIRETLFDDEELIAHVWRSGGSGRDFSAQVKPFPCLELHDVIADELLTDAIAELRSMNYLHRRSDLFSYRGTDDLAEVDARTALGAVRDALYSSRCIEFLARVTGVDLCATERPDLSSHVYAQGDYLACHDDDIRDDDGTGRRIAFILYLVETDWSESDGGALELFSLDRNGDPDDVARSIIPRFNTLVLFEVTPTSYHHVAEVVTARSERRSISGWFYGPLATRLCLRGFSNRFLHVDLATAVNAAYLDPARQAVIRARFAETSSVELNDFLIPATLARLPPPDDAGWSKKPLGPASVRRFHAHTGAGAVADIFRSCAFRAVLSSLTSMPQARAHRIIARKFARGCYTLVHDHARDAVGLDVNLVFGEASSDWREDWGGMTHYTTEADFLSDDESGEGAAVKSAADDLLTLVPKFNTLSIVLRDEGTLKHVDLVNSRAVGARMDVDCLFLVDVD